MSFILDALKKSENERQRQAGPGFSRVPGRSATRSRGIWPIVAIAVIAINLVVLGFVMMRGDDGREARTGTEDAPTPSVRPPGPAMPAAQPVPPPAAGPGRPAEAPVSPVPADAPVSGVAASTEGAEGTGEDRQIRGLESEAASAPIPAPVAPAPVPAVESPRPAPQALPAQTEATEPRRPDDGADLPTANELRLQGFLTGPPLHLDLHVYYPESHRRVVFISGARYKEGDRVKDGSVVREIVPEGVILEDRGRRYLLLPD